MASRDYQDPPSPPPLPPSSVSHRIPRRPEGHQTLGTQAATGQNAVYQAGPDVVAFGVENEFLLNPRSYPNENRAGWKSINSPIRARFLQALSDIYNQEMQKKEAQGLLNRPRLLNSLQGESISNPHANWKLTNDPTVETNAKPWGLDMVSPIILIKQGSTDWETYVNEVWQVLNLACQVSVNSNCSTHVHLSLSNSYSVAQMKRLAQAVIHFETAFTAFLPKERLQNEYARSNWKDNKCFANIDQAEAMQQLEKAREIDDIIDLMNPEIPNSRSNRYYGWNFTAFKKYTTVEFRRGAGSKSAEDTFKWITLATSFLNASLHVKGIKDFDQYPKNVGGLRQFLETDRGASRKDWEALLKGHKPTDSDIPQQLGKLTKHRLQRFNQKVDLDTTQDHNPMLRGVEQFNLENR